MGFAFAAAVGLTLAVAGLGKAITGERAQPLAEFALAAWLLSGLGAPVAAAVSLVALVVFAGVLLRMQLDDPGGDCGCFGPLAPASPLRALNRVAALFAAGVLALLVAADPSVIGAVSGAALMLLWRGGELLSDRLRRAAISPR